MNAKSASAMFALVIGMMGFLSYAYTDAKRSDAEQAAIRAEIAQLDSSPVAVVEDAPVVDTVATAKRAAAVAKYMANNEAVAYVAPRYSREVGGFMGHGNQGMMEP